MVAFANSMLAEGAHTIQWKKAIMEVYFQRAAFYEELGSNPSWHGKQMSRMALLLISD